MMKNTNTKIFKFVQLILFIITILLLIFLGLKLFPLFKNLGTATGQVRFKNEINNSGIEGIFILLGLQLLQILIPILPGEPIEFLSGMCYGTFWGAVIIFIGSFLSSFIIFFCVRKFGKIFIHTFFGEEKIHKIENSKWANSTKKIDLLLIIVFLLPGTPKDLFVYVSGLLPIKPMNFFIISTFCRFPSIVSSTLAGDTLVDGNWNITILIYAITFAISGIGLYFYNLMGNKKNTD